MHPCCFSRLLPPGVVVVGAALVFGSFVVALSPRALAQTAASAAAAAAKKRAAATATPPKPAVGKEKPTPSAAAPATVRVATPNSGALSDVTRAREAQIAELIREPPPQAAAPSSTTGSGGNGNGSGRTGDPNAPTVVTASKSELSALDQLDLEALELFSRWLTADSAGNNASNSGGASGAASSPATATPKAADLDAFMTRSRVFLKRRPDELRPWLMRARLALRNGRVAEGMEAAENLKRLGAVASPDERTHRMMLALNLKGWLQSDAPLNPDLGRALAAAELGDSEAQGILGRMFETGAVGVPKNPAEALRWRLRAADAGDAESQLSLAALYRNGGGGVPKDDTQSLVWYRKAARQGNVAAQDVLRKRDLSW